jgi:membrane-bound ClpP family serine protease
MAMHNSDTDFFGKQEGERILYVVKPHLLSLIFKLLKIYLIAFAVFLVLIILGTQLVFLNLFLLGGAILAVVIAIVGTKVVTDYQRRDMAYITDRRLMRFDPTTLFATNPRSLTWDEVVKVKTYPSNVFFKQLAIGNVVVHARTPARPDEHTPGTVAADDIELKDVYYYKDLGNYIDKILFTYKQKPKEMETIRPFIAKPKGERF